MFLSSPALSIIGTTFTFSCTTVPSAHESLCSSAHPHCPSLAPRSPSAAPLSHLLMNHYVPQLTRTVHHWHHVHLQLHHCPICSKQREKLENYDLKTTVKLLEDMGFETFLMGPRYLPL